LFQHLFPHERKEAEDVLHRLEAVAGLKLQLTKRREGRYGLHAGGAFDPWEDSAIAEGVAVKSKRESRVSRYVDLVCHGQKGEELLIAEYIADTEEPEVIEFWSEHGSARCAVLLCGKEGEPTGTHIYCRSNAWGEKLARADRYDPPAPIEFEIYENPGKRSIDELLEATRLGNEGLVPEVIAQWEDCMAMAGGPHGPGRWRPTEARRILDGLAATEKTEVAVHILRCASELPLSRSGFDEFEIGQGGSALATLRAEELFAPLLWRLPVEAACQYLAEALYPVWLPCLAAHRLLAGEVMGLRFDPVRRGLRDADTSAAQMPDAGAAEDDGRRWLYLVLRRLSGGRFAWLSEGPPPLLLWEGKLRKDCWWSGDPEELDAETRESAGKLLADESRLRAWLRARISSKSLVTGALLGRYHPPSGRIELYSAILDALAPLLEVQPRCVKSVVFIQLSVWAMAHQALDCDGQPGFGFAAASTLGPFQQESPVHVAISQYFAFRLIERLGDIPLMGAFEKLSEKQPEPYRRWRRMRHVPVERMRAALLQARSAESALGLPGAELE
jgi:hypothetical protein